MRTFLLTLVILTSISCKSQTSVFSTNSKAVDSNRYKDVKGSPYMFADFAPATIYDNKGNEIKDVMVNYNGFDHGVEVLKDDRITIIDEKTYPKVVIKNFSRKKSANPSKDMVLVPSPQKHIAGAYVQEIHISDKVKLYRKFRVSKSENETHTPGKTIVTERFMGHREFLLDYDGNVKQVKAKLDDVTKIIGHEKELKQFCKKTKNKLKSEQDWNDLLTFYSTL